MMNLNDNLPLMELDWFALASKAMPCRSWLYSVTATNHLGTAISPRPSVETRWESLGRERPALQAKQEKQLKEECYIALEALIASPANTWSN
jgi:hypothetical protein